MYSVNTMRCCRKHDSPASLGFDEFCDVCSWEWNTKQGQENRTRSRGSGHPYKTTPSQQQTRHNNFVLVVYFFWSRRSCKCLRFFRRVTLELAFMDTNSCQCQHRTHMWCLRTVWWRVGSSQQRERSHHRKEHRRSERTCWVFSFGMIFFFVRIGTSTLVHYCLYCHVVISVFVIVVISATAKQNKIKYTHHKG